MAEQCMSIFERDQLPAAANVEQCCATGLTAEGKTPKSLVEDMVPLLDSRDVRSVRAVPPAPVRADGGARSNTSKVRIIALYILHRDGVPDEDRRRLYQHARLSLAEQDAVNALALLGARISRGPGDRDTRRKLRARPAPDEARCSTAGSRALPDGLRDPPARRPYQYFHKEGDIPLVRAAQDLVGLGFDHGFLLHRMPPCGGQFKHSARELVDTQVPGAPSAQGECWCVTEP
jgi:hypothetical protein